MSTFEYYEFQAIDKPLTTAELAEIRQFPSRVKPTNTRAVFTYTHGDFPSDPFELLAEHFDALLYIANWGAKQLAFRFPRRAVDLPGWQPYTLEVESDFEEDGVTLRTSGEAVILNIQLHADDSFGWIDGEGILDRLTPLREDILRGDYRVLYLGWLLAAWLGGRPDVHPDDEEWPEEELLEPPVPPNLKHPTPALRAFVKFFDLPSTLVAAAAAASPDLQPAGEPLEEWVTLLPEAERNSFLVRVARGETGVGVQLLHRLRELGQPKPGGAGASAPRRRFSEILEAANHAERKRVERTQQAEQAARRRYLEELAQREPAMWQEVVTLIEQKQARAYDQAVALLLDLRDLAALRGELDQFQPLLAELRARYARSYTLLERMDNARLP